MDLVDEKDIAVLEVGEEGGQVTGPGQHGARGDAQPGAHFRGHDPGQGGLAQPRGPGEEEMVHRLVSLARRLEHDAQMLDELRLPEELGERARPETGLFDLFPAAGHDRSHQPGIGITSGVLVRRGQNLAASPGAHRLASSRNASRNISSTPTSSRRPSSAPRISSGA